MALSKAARSVWAKSGYRQDVALECQQWEPLWLHLLDAAGMARHLACMWLAPTIPDVVEAELGGSGSRLSPEEEFATLASWMAGVHDIGKATPAFSVQVGHLDDRMHEAGLAHGAVDAHERRKVPHGLAGQIIVQRWLLGQGWDRRSAEAFSSVVGAHHGVPATRMSRREATLRPHLFGGDVWSEVQGELLSEVAERTGAADLLPIWAKRACSQAFLVELSGLVIVADWLSSTEAYFPLLEPDDWGDDLLSPQNHAARVHAAISRIEFPTPWRPRDEGDDADELLRSRFHLPNGSRATEVQRAAVTAARTMDTPGILVIGEMTGGGKTEAACLAAEILAARTGRSGTLVALPTQATTDAMFSRELDWLGRIEDVYADGGSPSAFATQLIHGRQRLNKQASYLRRTGYAIRDRLMGTLNGAESGDDVEAPPPTDIGRDEPGGDAHGVGGPGRSWSTGVAILSWFSGRKRAMLSDFVVTTVDHLLFAAMRSPHLALRHLGLSRKVVIVDEVHSYSTYMNVYLDRALTWLGAHGVPVILLSATLSETRCSALIQAYRDGLHIQSGVRVPRSREPEHLTTPFPCLITADAEGVTVSATKTTRCSGEVRVRRLSSDAELVALLRERLVDGGCALVVRNTVRRAQETFRALREVFGEDVTLNHARFTVADRQAKDNDLLERFGPPHKVRRRPRRAVVVATQVVEQSLDVDFDLLVTDLAPIDLILQRMGRLHRHDRERPAPLQTALCYIDGLPSTSRANPRLEHGASAIYGEQDMLMSAAALNGVLERGGLIRVPEDVHDLIEAVYSADAPVPPAWESVLAAAKAKAADEQQIKRESAAAFLLPLPARRGDSASLVGWLESMASDDEEKGRAQVRDGEDSLEVILIEAPSPGVSEEPRTLVTAPGAPGIIIPTSMTPEARIARAMALSMVRLPPSLSRPRAIAATIAALDQNYVAAWQDNADLRGQLVLPLIHGRASINGVTLSYDHETGLTEVPKP